MWNFTKAEMKEQGSEHVHIKMPSQHYLLFRDMNMELYAKYAAEIESKAAPVVQSQKRRQKVLIWYY